MSRVMISARDAMPATPSRPLAVVVMATRNEAASIGPLLNGLRDYPVVLVDGLSTDGTVEIARKYPNVQIVHREPRGIADAYMYGFEWAMREEPQYIIQMDAGGTHQPKDIPRLLLIRKVPDPPRLAIGSRFIRRYRPRGYRTWISLMAASLMRRLEVNVRDATCGFRCWERSLLYEVLTSGHIQAKGHAFQAEMLYYAWRFSQGQIAEVPIEYRLTNSSLRPSELIEALVSFGRLQCVDRDRILNL